MTTTFAEVVAYNYEEIKRNFKAGLKDKGYPWDEDIMNDAFISCNSALKDKPITKSDAIKYYWTAYINKFKSQKLKEEDIVSLDDIDYDCIDEPYVKDIDRIYDIVISELQDEFGIRETYIWELYELKGVSSKKLKAMGVDIDNFIYFNKKIKRYIKKRIIPNNPMLKDLVKGLR